MGNAIMMVLTCVTYQQIVPWPNRGGNLIFFDRIHVGRTFGFVSGASILELMRSSMTS
jgi:hypothetical protein